MPKFGRTCLLAIEVGPDVVDGAGNRHGTNVITIPKDLKIEFIVNRQGWSTTQTATFRIYNLSDADRDRIYKDAFDYTLFHAIQFWAGYDTFMPMIFNGTVLSAYSTREGNNDITCIEAQDGGFLMTNGFASGWGVPNQAIPAGTSATQVIKYLSTTLPKTTGPAIVGNFPTVNMRDEVLFGNTWGLILQKSGGLATVDNGQVKVLNPNEAVSIPTPDSEASQRVPTASGLVTVPLIDAATGLLNAPRRSGRLVEWDMLFEPRMTLFQIIALKSTVNPLFSGVYRVVGFRHQGVVAPTESGPYQTTASFLFGLKDIQIVLGQIVQ